MSAPNISFEDTNQPIIYHQHHLKVPLIQKRSFNNTSHFLSKNKIIRRRNNKKTLRSCDSLPLLDPKWRNRRTPYIIKDLWNISFLANEIPTPSKMPNNLNKKQKDVQYDWRDLTNIKIKQSKGEYSDCHYEDKIHFQRNKSVRENREDDDLINKYFQYIKETADGSNEKISSLRNSIRNALKRIEKEIKSNREYIENIQYE